jgi:hypothetical protein
MAPRRSGSPSVQAPDGRPSSTELRLRHPAAETFTLLADQLAGVEHVSRVKTWAAGVFDVRRAGRGPLLVVWAQRDSFMGEDELPVTFDWSWRHG